MKGITFGPAGGRSMSRMQGTKVTLAGRTAFLPNVDVPFVLQKLTMGQIEAIPREQFAVTLIDKVDMPVQGSLGRRGIRLTTLKKKYRQKGFTGRAGNVVAYVRKPSIEIKVEDNGMKLYTAIISRLAEAQKDVDSLYSRNLVLSRNQRNNPPENNSGLFLSPIDDGSMSDCIKKAIVHFFGEKDTCKILGREYKLAVFCLLMHDYFIRIGILKNKTRTPFCDYLLKYVLADWDTRFTSRTFTGYAQEYKNVEQDFTEQGRLKINFNVHPEPSGTILDAFHEIGNYFHTSPYFERLRELRDNMKGFMI